MGVVRGHAGVEGGEGQGRGRRQVLRLFRLRPAHQGHALAPGARHAARPQRGHPRPRSRRGARGGQAAPGRAESQGRLRHRRARPSRRQVARRDGAAGLEVAARPVALGRSAGAPQGARRRRGDLGVLQEPEGPAAGRAGRPARHHGARSRLPHRRQGRRGGPDRQGRGHGGHLSRTSPNATGQARSPRWRRCACATRSIS